MKKVILTRSVQLVKDFSISGSSGVLIIEQDDIGGHIVSIPIEDIGFVDVALNAHATTLVEWERDDVRTMWTSTKITSDVPIPVPSTITDLSVEITDTVSSKLNWNAPQGFTGSYTSKVDSYYLIVSTSPISINSNYASSRLPIDPNTPNNPETFILPNLSSGQRYYVAIFSEKSAFGQNRRSIISNVATFFTTPLDGNASVPKRIPLNKDKIYESNLHINFRNGEIFTNYPSFTRLANQDYIIDNNGVPEGTPTLPIVSAYQSYGTLQPSWYNVGFYRVIFELDGIYDLDYLYMLVQNNNRFTIFTSGDGVNLIKAFDKLDTPTSMSGWTKIPLLEVARTNIKYIILALYMGDEWFNGFVPYGTRKNIYEIKGEKYKQVLLNKTFSDCVGTNGFLAENQYDWMGKISKMTRLYNNSDWIMANSYKTQNNQSSNPNDIEMVSSTSHMWNYNVKMAEMITKGNKELIFTLVSWPVYLRAPGIQGAGNIKPIDPGLDYRDLAVTTNPQSYKHIARIGASIAYLWGSNTNAPEACNQFIDNVGQKGLNLIKYIELGNEIERTWHGDNGYFNPQEAAAFMSALYDGHVNTMGPGMGIKSADPNIKLVIPGMVTINYSYIKEMMLWCDLNRGVGNYCWDVINFHHYNAFRFSTDTPVWSSVPAYGIPPEQGDLIDHTKHIVRIRSLFDPSSEMWVSEFGYDEQFGGMHSPQDATPELRGRHKGVWITRSMIIYKSLNLSGMMHYWYAGDTVRVVDLDPNNIQRELFMTSGLTDGVTWAGDRNRTPLQAWWFVVSLLKELENYDFSHIVTEYGNNKIVEDDIVLNYHPNLFIYAFKHKDTNEGLLVSWLGVDNWIDFNLNLRINNDISSVPFIDYINQDVRKSETGVTTLISTTIIDIGKSATFPITETIAIIKTNLIGTSRLIAPTNNKIQSITNTSVKLAWTDENIGTNKTRVYMSLNPNSDFAIIEEEYRDSAETTIINLISDTTYYFRLQFIDGARTSIVSPTLSITTLFLLEPPTNLAQKEATASTITNDWDFPVEDEITIDTFIIYRSNTANGEYIEVGRAVKNLREFRDIGLVANTQYFYKVRTARDAIVSNFSFTVAASTEAPSLDPPTVQTADVHSSGSYIDLTFDEELKDEQTAINAFTILETVAGGTIIAHPVSVISIGVDKTKVKLQFDITIFKSSSVTISYSASIGYLKSVYDVPVNTFNSFPVTNNTALAYLPLIGWTNVQSITVNRNYLSATGTGRGVAQFKIPANGVAVLAVSVNAQNSMILGLDQEPNSEGFNTMDYYFSKRNGVVDYKLVDTKSTTSVNFGVGIIRYRFSGIIIYLEVSYDNGLTYTPIVNSPQPPIDLFIKVYCVPSEQLLNIVGQGLTSNSDVIIPPPPTNLVIDDDTNSANFTNAIGYNDTDHEYSTNYAAVNPIWSNVAGKPIIVGDVNIPAGGFAVRVKEGTDRAHSDALVSTVAFTGTINSNNKIMVQKSSGGTILYSSNVLSDIVAWLASALIVEDITVQFNTSDVYYVPTSFGPNFENGIYWVTFQGANGVRPILDAQRSNASVLRVNQDYTIFRNMELRNADIENFAGCIIRGDGRSNVKFLDMIWDYGYCGIRATTGCHNLEFDNIICRNTKEGSLRLGNGVIIDQSNIIIKNIKLDDPTNGGLIEGSTYPYWGGFALKVTNGYHIENVGPLSGDALYDLGIVENSDNIVIKNVRGTKIYSIGNDNVDFINCYLPNDNYLAESTNINILQSFMGINISNCGKLLKVRGNIFRNALTARLRTSSDVPDFENNNVIIANTSSLYINYTFVDASPNFTVNAANLATYKETQGQNDIFVPYANRATLNLNPFGSLRGNSVGKQLITATIEGITDDVYSTPRTYPTDPGPFSGARPDTNDKPEPVVWIGDNLARTLVATHPLGTSEILVSANGGLYLPYEGVINVSDAPVAEGYYRAKIKAAPYRDESNVANSPAFSAKPDSGSYEVLRTMEIAFRGDFCTAPTTPNVNDYFGTNAQVTGITLNKELIDMTGALTGINLANFEKGFNGFNCNTVPVGDYIKQDIRNGFSINSGTSKLKLSNLNDTLKYQIYLIAATADENSAVIITANGTSYSKTTSLNYPLTSSGNMYSNPAVIRIDNLQSVGGEVILTFTKNGSSYQQVVLNYIIIEETNENKPA